MSKRIVVCCDGTWNTPDQKDDGVVCLTNVTRLAIAVAADALLRYGGGHALVRQNTGRGFGVGISRNILQAYRFLMGLYEEGDDIFLFGFSLGAYTVRSLAGLLRNSGLLLPENLHRLDVAYRLYRRRDPEFHLRAIESELFRRTSAREVRVHCIRV